MNNRMCYKSEDIKNSIVVIVLMTSILAFGCAMIEIFTREIRPDNFTSLYRKLNLSGFLMSIGISCLIVEPLNTKNLKYNLLKGSKLARAEAFFLIATIAGTLVNVIAFIATYLLFLQKARPSSVTAASDDKSIRTHEFEVQRQLTFSSSEMQHI